MKRGLYFLILATALMALLVLSASTFSDKSFGQSIELTKIRNIGHLVLASSGDTHSRVMPVLRLAVGTYKLTFERDFTPNPDSLIMICLRHLGRSEHYAVELWESGTNNLAYSFAVSDVSSETILPCQTRPMPKGHYEIVIHFAEPQSNRVAFLSGGIVLLLLTAGWSFYKSRQARPLPADATSTSITIGKMQFYPSQQKIVLGAIVTELTTKETQVLALLAQTPNVVVERSRLQKEIWEDQGIIVTRSLDIFISRLRKKLSIDSSVKIVNVHSKGYKLDIENVCHE